MQMPPQGQPPQGNNPYPADRQEAETFSNDILQVLYSDQQYENIVDKQLAQIEPGPSVVHAVGMIAASIVGDRLNDVRAQSGRSIEMELAAGAIRDGVVPALAQMAQVNGLFEMTPDEQKTASMEAIKTLDQMSQGAKQ